MQSRHLAASLLAAASLAACGARSAIPGATAGGTGSGASSASTSSTSTSSGGGAPAGGPCVEGMAPAAVAAVDLSSSIDTDHFLLALDADHAYWADPTQGIWRAPKAGGAASLVASADSTLRFAVDATSIYFSRYPVGDSGPVYRIPKEGGAATVFADDPGADLVIVDDAGVYWSSFGDIRRTAKSGTQPLLTLASQPHEPAFAALIADPTRLFWLHVDDVDPDVLSLYALDKAGGKTVLLAGAIHAYDLAQDEQHLYWFEWGTTVSLAGIWRKSKAGGLSELVVAVPNAWSLAVGDAQVYWVDGSAQSGVFAMPKAGGTPVALAKGPPSPSIAIDATCVYWFDTAAGRLMRTWKGAP